MPQAMQRQWPTLPSADPEQLRIWAEQITRLLQKGEIIEGLGPGDVTGPASAGDGNVPLFNGTTGKLLKDSGFPLTASGNRWGIVAIVDSIGVLEIGRYIDFHNSDGDTSDAANRIETNGGTVGLYENPNLGGLKRIVSLTNSTLAQGDVVYFDGTNFVRLAPGTSGQFLQTLGAAANPAWATNSAPVVAAAQATTSGTAFDFTGLPAEVSRIIVNFNGVSLSGTDDILVQIGDSGGIETSGYTAGGQAGNTVFTGGGAGYAIRSFVAANLFYGSMILAKLDTNTWVASYSGWTSQPLGQHGGGVKALSAGPLDRVRITRSGTNTFDAGSVNIVYD